MTDTSGIDFHNAAVIARLEAAHGREFVRLLKVLRYGSPFQFCLMDCRDQLYRDRLMADLDGLLPRGRVEGKSDHGLPAARFLLKEDGAACEAHVRARCSGGRDSESDHASRHGGRSKLRVDEGGEQGGDQQDCRGRAN